jgi:hypothetical protein
LRAMANSKTSYTVWHPAKGVVASVGSSALRQTVSPVGAVSGMEYGPSRLG